MVGGTKGAAVAMFGAWWLQYWERRKCGWGGREAKARRGLGGDRAGGGGG